MSLSTKALRNTDVDYINAHGTYTTAGDMIELKAIKKLI